MVDSTGGSFNAAIRPITQNVTQHTRFPNAPLGKGKAARSTTTGYYSNRKGERNSSHRCQRRRLVDAHLLHFRGRRLYCGPCRLHTVQHHLGQIAAELRASVADEPLLLFGRRCRRSPGHPIPSQSKPLVPSPHTPPFPCIPDPFSWAGPREFSQGSPRKRRSEEAQNITEREAGQACRRRASWARLCGLMGSTFAREALRSSPPFSANIAWSLHYLNKNRPCNWVYVGTREVRR